jgi:hypothetical protein
MNETEILAGENLSAVSLEIEDAEDRVKPLEERFERLDEIVEEISRLKQERNQIKKELVALSECEVVTDGKEHVIGFTFNPLLKQYTRQSNNGKHLAAILDLEEYGTILQVQAQEVTDWNDVHEDLKARREVENNSSTPSSAFVVDTLDWTERIIKERTRYRVQSRVVTKTR